MRALVLEDSNSRVKQFKQRFLERGWVGDYVDTARDAIALLSKETYDIVFLDHDLGGEVYVATSNNNTGSEVARWLNDHPVDCPVIIHSLNVPAVDHMLMLLPKAYRIPFVWNKREFDMYIDIKEGKG